MEGSVITVTIWNIKERPLQEQICKMQFDMIKELAQNPCVIVGRCADSKNYDLCINTSGINEETAVQLILAYIEKKYNEGDLSNE